MKHPWSLLWWPWPIEALVVPRSSDLKSWSGYEKSRIPPPRTTYPRKRTVANGFHMFSSPGDGALLASILAFMSSTSQFGLEDTLQVKRGKCGSCQLFQTFVGKFGKWFPNQSRAFKYQSQPRRLDSFASSQQPLAKSTKKLHLPPGSPSAKLLPRRSRSPDAVKWITTGPVSWIQSHGIQWNWADLRV